MTRITTERLVGVALAVLAGSLQSGRADHLDVTDFPSPTWTKDAGVRLDLDAADPPGTAGFHTPYVFRFPDGTWRMYYDAFGTSPRVTLSAVSTDGLAWTKEPGVRLSGGDVGTDKIGHPHLIETGPGQYRMYFETSADDIRSASSTDGLSWTVDPGVRLEQARDPVVLELPGGDLRMYFRFNGTTEIGSAVSSDGLFWLTEPGVRLTASREFGAIRLPDGVVVIYFDEDDPPHTAIFSARSTDGLSFTVDPGTRLLPSAGLDSSTVGAPSIVQFPDGAIRMYYQGSPNADINLAGRVFSATAVLLDSDLDGLTDGGELAFGTDPQDPDTDDDGLLDGTEVDVAAGTGCPDPLDPDSDGDTLDDGAEVLVLMTDACSADSDGDGVADPEDPLPLEPGVTPEFLEQMTRDIADEIQAVDLSLFEGPNDNVKQGRRSSLATSTRNAANAIAAGNTAGAINLLEGVLARLDGEPGPPDWMQDSPEKTTLAGELDLLIALLTLG